MSDPKFPILGADVPPMLGRNRTMNRLWSDLTKHTPSHLSVVGPRFAGKSVLLKALDERMCGEGSPYCAVILWDLGHRTPASDGEFMTLLCQRLGEGLKSADNEYGDHLLGTSEGQYGEICEVMDILHGDANKVLMLWDGFDRPLAGGTLTRNLWDNLLELCRKPSFRLVTGTRKELHQLIRDEESVTSDFWGVFEGVVRVGIFDETDFDAVLVELPGLQFKPGARTELMNWSGGFPPLLLGILNELVATYGSGKIGNHEVNLAGVAVSEKQAAMLADLWEDCPAAAKDLYIILTERGELSIGETRKEERACLVEKGFASQSGNRLQASCRMLQEHIKGAKQDVGSMARLFGTWDDYHSNIRSFLERRLAHISRFDDRLYRYVEISISLLPNDPELSLNNLTSIEERALDLIWQCEFGDERKLSQETINYWTMPPRNRNKLVGSMMRENSWEIPPDRGRQVGMLQLLTGSQMGFEGRTRSASKDTYILINAIHSYRNRSQHGDGQDMQVGVAVAAIMTCLELLGCLEREMGA